MLLNTRSRQSSSADAYSSLDSNLLLDEAAEVKSVVAFAVLDQRELL